MKRITAFFIVLPLFASCSKSIFTPSPSANPWADDYSSISSIENYRQWGVYNVHDPECKRLGGWYYMYSTDAVFADKPWEARQKNIPVGFIQVRRSQNLVDWEFRGWAFPAIPQEAVDWVRSNADGRGAYNIWAPCIVPYGDVYRLYYCVSAFGKKTSYLGLAESASPEGPWTQKGCVVKTNNESPMNAIDPTIIQDRASGKWTMIYGSFFGGLYSVELNPETGLTMRENDLGRLVARRADYRKDNLEAPEIIYHPELKKYFLFTSYDPLMTTYNVRAGRGGSADGDFYDFFGQNLKDTLNDFPILTAAYRFDNHPGWAGVGHCGVFQAEDGQFFMVHQGRLSPQNTQMILHVRQVFFTRDGWPAVSPERYAGTKPRRFRPSDLAGKWEIIRIREPQANRNLEAGQVAAGQGQLLNSEWNTSSHLTFSGNGSLNITGEWSFAEKEQLLDLNIEGEQIRNLIVFAGHDWENERETVLFTGLDASGRSVWGKRIE
ncbi:MAG: arabinan endo-1,5-alpha-L-arabinosidase [Dysgonamonadaceae bacterium]|nr:arabinan endo-1,5-alpha-L-arabinosidase [Dysgonamonadaceae bacterium]